MVSTNGTCICNVPEQKLNQALALRLANVALQLESIEGFYDFMIARVMQSASFLPMGVGKPYLCLGSLVSSLKSRGLPFPFSFWAIPSCYSDSFYINSIH